MNARKHTKFGKFAALAFVGAAVAAPLGQATTDGAPLSKAGRQAALVERIAQDHGTDATYLLAPYAGFDLGHPGGPGAGGPVLPAGYAGRELVGGPVAGGPVVTAQPTAQLGDGFDWTDAGIGAGFAVGLSLVAAGASLMMRRRRQALAHVQP